MQKLNYQLWWQRAQDESEVVKFPVSLTPTLMHGLKLWVVTDRRGTSSGMSFLHRIVLRSKIGWQWFRVKPLLLYTERRKLMWFEDSTKLPPGCVIGDVFWSCPRRWHPQDSLRTHWEDSISWVAWKYVSVSESWRRWLDRERSGLLYLACCPWNLQLGKGQKTDRQYLYSMHWLNEFWEGK